MTTDLYNITLFNSGQELRLMSGDSRKPAEGERQAKLTATRHAKMLYGGNQRTSVLSVGMATNALCLIKWRTKLQERCVSR